MPGSARPCWVVRRRRRIQASDSVPQRRRLRFLSLLPGVAVRSTLRTGRVHAGYNGQVLCQVCHSGSPPVSCRHTWACESLLGVRPRRPVRWGVQELKPHPFSRLRSPSPFPRRRSRETADTTPRRHGPCDLSFQKFQKPAVWWPGPRPWGREPPWSGAPRGDPERGGSPCLAPLGPTGSARSDPAGVDSEGLLPGRADPGRCWRRWRTGTPRRG